MFQILNPINYISKFIKYNINFINKNKNKILSNMYY